MGWGNIYRRRVKVFTLAMIIYIDYKALQKREKFMKKPKSDALWKKAHERNAKRVFNLMVELEGLWVKLGQYMSSRADVLPSAFISNLKQLQDSLPPRPFEEVCHTIEKELGKSTKELFLDFDENPLATASIAQVHRATLIDGQKVVVKVQHEDIKKIILEDLKDAKSIVDWIAWAEPQYNFSPMIDEWCKEAPQELDFNHEAENTRTVSRNLGCTSKYDSNKPINQVDVLIPEVIQSTEKVLILEYMDGIRLNDFESLEACGANNQKIVEEITRAFAHQIYVDGFFNGDPHPGNFLVSKEPPHRPILLDFGLTKRISSSMKQSLAKMFLATAEAMDFISVFFRTSTSASEAAVSMHCLPLEFYFDTSDSNLLLCSCKEICQIFGRVKSKKHEGATGMNLSQKEVKQFNPIDAFPGDMVIFSWVIGLLRGLSTTLDARIVYHDIMRPFAESVLQEKIAKGPSENAQWIIGLRQC